MNKLKTLLTLTTLALSSTTFAECVIDSNFIQKSWEKKDIPRLDCPQLNITVQNSAYKSRYAEFGRVKKDITLMIFHDTDEQKEAIKRIDLSELPADYGYVLYINDNKNLEELNIGEIKKLKQLHMKGNDIVDVRFLENITFGEIYITKNIEYFPSENSPFCESMKAGYIAFNQNDTNQENAQKACGIEIEEE